MTKTPRLHGGDGVPTLTLDKHSVSSFGGKSTQSNNPCEYNYENFFKTYQSGKCFEHK